MPNPITFAEDTAFGFLVMCGERRLSADDAQRIADNVTDALEQAVEDHGEAMAQEVRS